MNGLSAMEDQDGREMSMESRKEIWAERRNSTGGGSLNIQCMCIYELSADWFARIHVSITERLLIPLYVRQQSNSLEVQI